MAKSATSEEIIAKPAVGRMSWSRRAEHVWAIGRIGVSEVSYYRWRREFGEMQIKQVKRLKELELEISEAARGNC